MSKNILITGSSAGFGLLTVHTLLNKGHNVIATMRGAEGKNKKVADELESAGAHVVDLDVTDDNSVKKAITTAINKAGKIDVVIHNAGVGVLGLQETYTVEDWKKLFEVNVFGVQRVNRAVLPHMRANNSGLLIFVSSLLGRITLPFYGPYNASKWALEAMAESYRTELSGFGVDISIVEPGGYPTSFMDNLMQPSDESQLTSYGPMAQAPKQMFDAFEQALLSNKEQKPQDVADTILNLIETPVGQRAFRNPVDKMGMGDPIKQYNENLEQIMNGLMTNFGMQDMLKVKA